MSYNNFTKLWIKAQMKVTKNFISKDSIKLVNSQTT